VDISDFTNHQSSYSKLQQSFPAAIMQFEYIDSLIKVLNHLIGTPFSADTADHQFDINTLNCVVASENIDVPVIDIDNDPIKYPIKQMAEWKRRVRQKQQMQM